MPNRRQLLKSGLACTAIVSSPGLSVAKEERRDKQYVTTATPADQVSNCQTEVLTDNSKYRDIYAACGDESAEVRYYKNSGEIVFITKPGEDSKLKGQSLQPQSISLPDPPSLVKSWENREEEIHSNCAVPGISDHLFVGADIELTEAGTTVSAGLLAVIACGVLGLRHPIAGIACGIGGVLFDWIFLQGYGVEGEGTVGLMDVDESRWIYTEQSGWVYVDSPAVAAVGAPYTGASTDELEFFKLIEDFSSVDLPQAEPVHLEPLLDEL